MEKKKTGCNGFYLTQGNITCEAIGGKIVTIQDCKKCTCPSNKYRKD